MPITNGRDNIKVYSLGIKFEEQEIDTYVSMDEDENIEVDVPSSMQPSEFKKFVRFINIVDEELDKRNK